MAPLLPQCTGDLPLGDLGKALPVEGSGEGWGPGVDGWGVRGAGSHSDRFPLGAEGRLCLNKGL